jgi:uncharacterized membrane protein YphA (DoxX/SURF4 family)
MANNQHSKGLHISLWVAQVLLALAFGMSGFLKISSPIEKLAEMGMTFVTSYDPATVQFIGVAELLAAIGLILPSALRLIPILTPLAATGLAIIMILATQYHIAHDESPIANLVLFAIAVFVAWGRFKKAPIQPKK